MQAHASPADSPRSANPERLILVLARCDVIRLRYASSHRTTSRGLNVDSPANSGLTVDKGSLRVRPGEVYHGLNEFAPAGNSVSAAYAEDSWGEVGGARRERWEKARGTAGRGAL